MIANTSAETASPTAPAVQSHVMSALLLDDNEVDRMRLRRLCTRASMTLDFHEAADLAELRRALDRRSFDLVFIDYQLGLDTGLDALKMVIAHEDQVSAIPIMVTSFSRYDVAIEAMREGCADYLVKEEMTEEALRRSVTSAIERRILLGAVSEAQAFRSNLRATLSRFSRTCGPEMRGIMSGLLRQTKTLRRSATIDPDLAYRLTQMERGCNDLFVLLDDLATVLDEVDGDLAHQPPAGLKPH